VIVALVVDAGGGHAVADTCGLRSNHNIRVVLLLVEVHDAEGAPAQLSDVHVLLVVVEYQGVKGLWEGVLVLLMRDWVLFLLVFVLTVKLVNDDGVLIRWIRGLYLVLLLFFLFLFFFD
jgi:hypothetical protein